MRIPAHRLKIIYKCFLREKAQYEIRYDFVYRVSGMGAVPYPVSDEFNDCFKPYIINSNGVL